MAKKKFHIIDPITGQKVKSDTVYSDSSKVGQAWDRTGGGNFLTTAEYEFGKRQIVATIVGSPKEGYEPGVSSINRWVFQGKFKYATNGNITGSLSSITQGTFYPISYPDGDEPYEYINADRPSSSKTSFKSSSQLRSLMAFSDSPEYDLYNFAFKLSDGSRAANAENGIYYDTDKSRLGQFGLEKFFSGDWWTQPFESNLI